MIALLLAAAGAPMTPVDAERAFAADAQKLGQWTAFTKWSADDAIMFVPQPVNAHEFLQGRKNPPVAVFWWPGRSYVSCDGSYAVNTGPWVREWGKAVGFFTTVWKRQSDGSWKWIYDGGDGLKTPRAEGGEILPKAASCDGSPTRPADPAATVGVKTGGGASDDGSLRWTWTVAPDGSREFRALVWNGHSYEAVVTDTVKAE
jgi:hypothetical protein